VRFLQAGEIGNPVSVLLGHTAPVSFVSFHPLLPAVLLSSSFDGTCRLWDASAGGGAMHVLRAGPQPGVAMAQWLPTRPEGNPTPPEETAGASGQPAAEAPEADAGVGAERAANWQHAGASGADQVNSLA